MTLHLARMFQALLLSALAMACLFPAKDAPAAGACRQVGQWVEPATGRPLDPTELIHDLATKRVVLLGETHTSAEDHRWQLQVLSALQALRPDTALAFEAFPRRVQPVLDRWVAGDLDAKAFLKEADWETVWSYDAADYLPLFHLARMNGLPMIAMNVDIALIRKVGQVGWDETPDALKEGVSRPAPAQDGYLDRLAAVVALKQRHAQTSAEKATEPKPVDRQSDSFRHFVAAQQTWDRAMAEAIAKVADTRDAPLVVGIVGRGHLEYGYGIPAQLADLGIDGIATLMTAPINEDCEGPIADAVFTVNPPLDAVDPASRPRLGVFIENREPGAPGILVRQVIEGSVAATAGLRDGDILLEAGGQPLTGTTDLITVINRQSPGNWLPLVYERGGNRERAGNRVEAVARFPPAPVTAREN